jgi:hypothetical protein
MLTAGFSEPAWFKLAEGVFLIGFIIAGFGIVALVGEIGVRIGTWIATPVTGHHDRVR